MAKKHTAFELPATLTIQTAEEVREQLQAYLEKEAKAITLSGAGVQEVKSPGLQLLVACALRAKQRNAEFSIAQPSPVLKDALADAGLCHLLD
jgi:anti-anti-sigma factor